MLPEEVEEALGLLDTAERTATPISPLTARWPGLDVSAAYEIQDRSLRGRLGRGDVLVGVKLGLTSVAKQRSMNVDVPLTAWLTEGMRFPRSAVPFCAPRAEPEIVFVLGERLAGPNMSPERALDAVAEVRAGIEIIDSRFEDYRFSLPDVVADNGSAAGFVLGDRAVPATEMDLSTERCCLSVDGEPVAVATGAAVLGHPARALALAANVLAARGFVLEAGWIVLTGGLTDAVPLERGTVVEALFDHLGMVSVSDDEI
jgi:2-oxo-3-hexenedioate decarboxylase